MAILRERKTWKREPTPDRKRNPPAGGLAPEEQEHLAAALRFLRQRHGSWEALATLTGLNRDTLSGKPKRLGPGLAIRVARAAGIPVEDILTGRWPAPGMCPTCGRSEPPTR